jgi:adenylate cyclase
MSSFFSELKRRNVYKVAVAYAVAAWLVVQIAAILFATFDAPPWAMKVFIAAIAVGFPVALILAWAFELTPEGIKRVEDVTSDEPRRRPTTRRFVAVVVAGAIVAGALYLEKCARGDRGQEHRGAAIREPEQRS